MKNSSKLRLIPLHIRSFHLDPSDILAPTLHSRPVLAFLLHDAHDFFPGVVDTDIRDAELSSIQKGLILQSLLDCFHDLDHHFFCFGYLLFCYVGQLVGTQDQDTHCWLELSLNYL